MIEAVNGGTVVVGDTISNAGGTLFASGTNSTVILDLAHMTGGTFKTAGTGAAIEFENANTITGVTNTGVLSSAASNSSLTLGGSSFTNTTTGVVNLLNTGSKLIIGNDLSLQGGGKINLNFSTSIAGDGTHNATLTNVDNTIPAQARSVTRICRWSIRPRALSMPAIRIISSISIVAPSPMPVSSRRRAKGRIHKQPGDQYRHN